MLFILFPGLSRLLLARLDIIRVGPLWGCRAFPFFRERHDQKGMQSGTGGGRAEKRQTMGGLYSASENVERGTQMIAIGAL